jgi:hypothetical protein
VLNFWVFIILRHGSFFLPSGEVDLDEFENKDVPLEIKSSSSYDVHVLLEMSALALHLLHRVRLV